MLLAPQKQTWSCVLFHSCLSNTSLLVRLHLQSSKRSVPPCDVMMSVVVFKLTSPFYLYFSRDWQIQSLWSLKTLKHFLYNHLMTSQGRTVCFKSEGRPLRYEVLEALGEGVFGTVTKCRNRATNQIVVLKVMKKDEKMCLNFKRELEMLEHISPVFNLVKFIEFFDFQDRQSMVFEMLDISVYDLMQEEFPFSLSQARPVAKQLLIALQGLQDIAVIHADIKPDNIMLVNHREQPFKVKLIDFGVAKRSDQVYPGQMMQPISVRAPEVRLGLPLWEAVDMWSLACCLLFFCYETAEEFFESTGENPDMSEEQHSIYNLEELIKRSREFVSEQESNDRDAFHDLLSKMLEINAEKRITPAQALLHPFITMDHLPKGDNYTKEAHELMRVAETMYGPLQRENLEKIAEKQKEEAIAANDFTAIFVLIRMDHACLRLANPPVNHAHLNSTGFAGDQTHNFVSIQGKTTQP
uniref:Protein kinase domain-containing protein n=1 Tax=Periophthalmus magnuspinnatus TaxID=409849 RepID=A0A3B3ZK93_9GOBI